VSDPTNPQPATRASLRAAHGHQRGKPGKRRRPGRRTVLISGILGCLLVAVGVLAATRFTRPEGGAEPPSSVVADRIESRGGTLHALSLGPVATWDPQRIGARDAMAFAGRMFVRTLTAYAPSTDPGRQSRLVGDLATDTGKASADLRTWSFTLREDARWQDGSPVTCADVAYGISRTFATKDITGGPTDALAVLAIARNADGTSTYAGPYVTGPSASAGQAAYDKAVRCDGSTIVFALSVPVADFDEMVSQPAFGPVKKSADKGREGTFEVFSSGPYSLRGLWEPGVGGTFVRNPRWNLAADPVRRAYPDILQYREGLDTQAVVQQVMADGVSGRATVSLESVPPAVQQNITSVQNLRERSLNQATGLVDYLVPNLRSVVFRNVKARLALAAATKRDAYVTAIGGSTAADETRSLIPSLLPAAHDADPVGAGPGGDVALAKKLLAEAGLTGRVRFTVAYRSDPTSDKAMAALVAGWREAGFDPVPQPIGKDYFSQISSPALATKVDVFWSNWAPAWASASTILPPLFDSSINLTSTGPGRDYGYFADVGVNASIAKIGRIADRAERERAWSELDVSLLGKGAYIGLAERRALYVAGGDVRNLSANAVAGGVIEFADIAVAP
jgi:peptide/nickel transport system substrate-binding protein